MTIEIPEVYYNNDKNSFGWTTARSRWIIIVQQAADDVKATTAKIPFSEDNLEKSAEGYAISDLLIGLKKAIDNDEPIVSFDEDAIESTTGLEYFNRELENLGPMTWKTAPWLFSEAILYRIMHSYFTQSTNWRDYDVFEALKEKTFFSSCFGVTELATRYRKLVGQLENIEENVLEILFREYADISLWGNATDLSLLANASLEDIQSLQGSEARKKSEDNILVNDLHQAWSHLFSISESKKSKSEKVQVDYVLDNAGFELYADLNMALFLLDSKIVDTVVLHCKPYPWMVSDVMPKDFEHLLRDLENGEEYFGGKSTHPEDLKFISSRISKYHSDGHIKITSDPFWCLYTPFWEINPNGKDGGDKIYKELQKSDLVIFKGDLNYRRLTADAVWPRTTSFLDAIGELASGDIPVLSLRTCKADVLVGLPQGLEEELNEQWRNSGNTETNGWAWTGKYAVMSFSKGDKH